VIKILIAAFLLVWDSQAKGPLEDLIWDNQVKLNDDEIGEFVFVWDNQAKKV